EYPHASFQLADEAGGGPLDRRLLSLTTRPNQNWAPGVSATIVARKPMRARMTCHADPSPGVVIPCCSSQPHFAFCAVQAGTIPQPSGSPAWATSDTRSSRLARQLC